MAHTLQWVIVSGPTISEFLNAISDKNLQFNKNEYRDIYYFLDVSLDF